MGNMHGDFIWYELLTPDPASAATFYGAVLGWTSRDAGGPTPGYGLFSTAEIAVAGFMAMPPGAAGAGMPPQWLGYVAVEDVDASVRSVLEAGGTQHMPPIDLAGIGRFALLADPQGAPFYVMRGATEDESSSFAPEKTGHCRWNELSTDDQPAALAFYGRVFGWEKGNAMPMGDLGEYRFISHRGVTLGAVMTTPPGGPRPGWRFYFGVADIDRAAEAIRSGGGAVQFGPDEVPGGLFIVVGTDPQGAPFAVVGPRNA
ncbi:hypothetical protein SAMN02745194_02569 [Roseomonas rosea]|uniref:VOC domain-containing protein n=1 Tax=Muricoccus roseus TaxID=198092 RepID=A0A1M6J8D1_9PROT|nr:VOC family protein [Roseomonas rosea]SHJ42983.1 hypothetical protein SAMN02745194_02569 [Roseomonas rosea]